MQRTIAISNHYVISASNDLLVLTPMQSGLKEAKIACIDIAYLILEHPRISITQHAIEVCGQYNVAVVFVSMNYLPTSMLFHLDTHGVQFERFKIQLESSEPLRKQLWAQTVKSKIENQAALLEVLGFEGQDLFALAKRVKSGDVDNLEGQAARRFWPRLFGPDFTRDRKGESPNHFLNYGYTLLRAATARALCGRGLYPLMGIHHQNRYNHFALADDMMEPFRPYIDWEVFRLYYEGSENGDISLVQKQRLLKLLACDIFIDGQWTNLTHALEIMCTSLVQCFSGERKKIIFPELILRKDDE